MALLYKEHIEKAEYPTNSDYHMKELESIVNARKRGIMTRAEYRKCRREIEDKLFDFQDRLEEKRELELEL